MFPRPHPSIHEICLDLFVVNSDSAPRLSHLRDRNCTLHFESWFVERNLSYTPNNVCEQSLSLSHKRGLTLLSFQERLSRVLAVSCVFN